MGKTTNFNPDFVFDADRTQLESLMTQHGVTWPEFMHQLAIYPEITEQALKLPREISSGMTVNVTTVHDLMPLWLDNIHHNFESIKNGLDIKDIPKTDRPALIIGAGPSLYSNNHLQLLNEVGFDGIIFAADRVLKDCLEAGVIPDYVLILDGSIKILPYIDHDIIDEYSEKIGAILCVSTHPDVVTRWKGRKYWYINSIAEDIAPNTAYLLYRLIKKTEMTTAGHASSLGWSVAYTIGCREIALIGLDLSHHMDTPIENTPSFSRYLEMFDGDVNKIRESFKTYHHTVFDTDCYYDPVFESYIECSMTHFRSAASGGCEIVNCSEGGAIEGDDVKCMRFSDLLHGKA
ncbi:MAG: DUF115 domain-containing protein [Gammaproteobacteria bacterium]|nr:DUF115 domain-containing protein [Gammaproteobacteria bacterium]